MTLPPDFHSAEQYFEQCIQFFREYQHFYNYRNTDILLNDALENIHVCNLENLAIFSESFDLESINDSSLNVFFDKLKRFQVVYDEFVEDKDMEEISKVPLSPKKRHEIVYLTKSIKELAQDAGWDTVVDFGSGLGYLDQTIFEKINYNVLGLECEETNYVTAKIRQRKYHKRSTEKVKYIRHTISENSDLNIKEFLEDKFPNNNGFCITGLHSCADLSIDAMNIFLKMEKAMSMVIMPCCHHKLSSTDRSFKNFPLSNCMRKYYEEYNASDFMKVPFLRVGTQPPNISDTLQNAAYNLIARAVLQAYAFKHNCRLIRKSRKPVKTKELNNDLEKYIEAAIGNGFTLVQNDDDKPLKIENFDQEEIKSYANKIGTMNNKKAGILILLQNYLQPVIENFILLDRLTYLQEKGIKDCRFKKIFDEKLSPRSYVLIASK